jgi:hypothetical protein
VYSLGNKGRGLGLLNAGTKKRKRPEPREKVELTLNLSQVSSAPVDYWSGPGLQSPKQKKKFQYNEKPNVFAPSS